MADALKMLGHWTHDDIAEMAMAALVGTDDPEIAGRIKKAKRIISQNDITLRFNQPSCQPSLAFSA
jgi:hypothetical protein